MTTVRNTPLRDLVYSVPQAMKITGYARDRIESAIAVGQLEAIMIGKRRLITKASVDLLIDYALYGRHRTGTTDPIEALRQLAEECAPTAE